MDNRSIEVHILIVDMRYHRAEDTPQTFTRFIGEACDSSHARMGKKHCKKKLVKKKKKKWAGEKEDAVQFALGFSDTLFNLLIPFK